MGIYDSQFRDWGILFRTTTVLLAIALSGSCGSKKQQTVGMNLAGTGVAKVPSVDPTLCDTKGKQVSTSDLNQDNRPDVWKLYETINDGGTKVQVLTCKQIDFDRDGRKDYVVAFHNKGGMLFEKIDFTFDGRFDSFTQYDRKTGLPYQVERDSDFDGAYDITEQYDAQGKLSAIQRDRNGDRNPDLWEQYEQGKLVAILYDDDFDKKVDRREEAPSETKDSPIPADQLDDAANSDAASDDQQ